MDQSQTTITLPPDLSNTTDNDFNETGTSNNTFVVTTPAHDDAKSVYSIFLLELVLPFGCLFVILAIFFVFYFFKLRKTNHGTSGMDSRRNEHDNDSFQPDGENLKLQVFNDVKTLNRNGEDSAIAQNSAEGQCNNRYKLQDYDTIVLPNPTRSANGRDSAVIQNNAEEKGGNPIAQNSAKGLSNNRDKLQDYDTVVLPNPTRSATYDENCRHSAASQNNAEEKEDKLNLNMEEINVDVTVSTTLKPSTTDDSESSPDTGDDQADGRVNAEVRRHSCYETVKLPEPTRRAASEKITD